MLALQTSPKRYGLMGGSYLVPIFILHDQTRRPRQDTLQGQVLSPFLPVVIVIANQQTPQLPYFKASIKHARLIT